jgi:hypothetical protein
MVEYNILGVVVLWFLVAAFFVSAPVLWKKIFRGKL